MPQSLKVVFRLFMKFKQRELMLTPFLQTSNTSKPPPIHEITRKNTGLKVAVEIIELQKKISLSPLLGVCNGLMFYPL